MINISGNIYQDFINMLFYHVIYFLILFLVLVRDGVLFFWVQDGLEVIFYYFVFGNLGF